MKTKKKKSILFRALLLCVSVYLVISLSSLWGQLAESKKQLSAYETQIEDTNKRINELENLLKEGNEKKIIEKAARERLGYLYPNEKVYDANN